jgi:shikimate dehydrogenase
MWQSFRNRLIASAGSIFPDARTALYGVWGYPIHHSLSPALHNQAFRFFGINALYLAFAVHPQDLERAVEGARALGFSGWNLTIPLKEAVLPYLDLITPSARRIGAVNTVVVKEGRLEGHNTDAPGFLMALRRHVRYPPRNLPAVIIGTGGVGRAVAFALAEEGIPLLFLINRTRERAERLWEELKADYPHLEGGVLPWREPLDDPEFSRIRLFVHCTSRGLHGSPPLSIVWERIPRDALFFDLVYQPGGTVLLKEAKRRKIRAISGEELLVAQGALAFELWTGKKWDLRRAMVWFRRGARRQGGGSGDGSR